MADTAARLALIARRYEVARFTIVVSGLDLTGVAMNMQVRLQRGTPGAPLISLGTVSTTAAEGLKLDSVTTVNGLPTSIIKGHINQATMTDATKVPYAGELGADTVLAYAMQWTLNGDANTRVEGDFIVRDSAYGSDNAPTSRTVGYGGTLATNGSASGSLTFGDQVIYLSIEGSDLLAASLAAAAGAATQAQTASGQAQISAAIAATSKTAPATLLRYWTPADDPRVVMFSDPADRASLVLAGTVVDTVADRSTFGTHLKAPAAAQRPGYSDATNSPVLYYTGKDKMVLVSPALTLAQPFTFMSMARPDNISGVGTLNTLIDAGTGGGTGVTLRANQGSGVWANAGKSLTGPALSKGNFHLVSASFNAGRGRIVVDGALVADGDVGTNNINALQVRLGDSSAGDAPYGGAIAQSLVTSGVVEPGDDLYDRFESFCSWKIGGNQYIRDANPWRYCPPVTGALPVQAYLMNRGAAMIPHVLNTWIDNNVFDPRVMIDPFDSTKLMMYTSGQEAPVASGVTRIGLWRASRSNPYAWTFDRIVLEGGASGQWDGPPGHIGGVRLGSVLYRNGTFYMYYASQFDPNSIGVATSTDGVTFTKYAGNPILTPASPGRTDESGCGDPFVYEEDGRWTLFYSYRTTAGLVLPGFRCATSIDPFNFTKLPGEDALHVPRKEIRMEGHQIIKRNGRYYIIFEMGGSPADGTPYRCFVAQSDTLTGPYTIKKLLVKENPSGTDKLHAATPFLFFLDGIDLLFWSGSGEVQEPYYNNHWDLFGAQVANAL
jgi:hypothetical protein